MKHYVLKDAKPEEEVKFLGDKMERDRICAEIDERIRRNTTYCKKHGDPEPVSYLFTFANRCCSGATDVLKIEFETSLSKMPTNY